MFYIGPVLATFDKVRGFTEILCEPLKLEDYVVQSMSDVSPPKWHLGHTTWFFETFLLVPFLKNYQLYHPEFAYIFNSYYKTVGSHFERCRRGVLSRPTVEDTYRYRRQVNEGIHELFEKASLEVRHRIDPILELGIHHEQQHQELLLTDIKHIFGVNPLKPAYKEQLPSISPEGPGLVDENRFITFSGGVKEIGYGGSTFSFDNERPQHRVYLNDFSMASHLVTNGEFLEFMEAGGYSNPSIWLSDGWNSVEKYRWNAPLYWEKRGKHWWNMTYLGMMPVVLNEPVCHVSFFEADAFSKWKNARLPTEAEWETVALKGSVDGNFVENGYLRPTALTRSAQSTLGVYQLFGDVWEWTSSSYQSYPGFAPLPGAIGEYNGKFMCNQMILRGGSCVTSKMHIRATYRNFFGPETRWQFTGFRLAGAPSLHESLK
jgi:ergothioneine biosynthesis protein EgtB